jgi:peptidoglycan/xylan/chitin deacetylase (PgdA/CDA1 family)
MYLARTPAIARVLYGSRLWRMPVEGSDKSLYLTFDDGPDPEVTPWVLDQLRAHDAKATFFCIGKNIEANPDVFECVKAEGHVIGNHTWDHCNGRDTATATYLDSVERCQQLTGTTLFRPPYGRLMPAQGRALRDRWTVVMWSVLSADFDARKDGEHCTRNVLKHAAPGGIVVFHDSAKAWPRLELALPKVLEHFSAQGYTFKSLTP